jgi:hypothetical protein
MPKLRGTPSRLINLLEIHVVTQPVVFGLGSLVLAAASRASARRVGLIPCGVSPATE